MTTLSRQRRQESPEADALRMGCGWGRPDTDKAWILVESTHGDSHPGSVHLGELATFVEKGILSAGATPARYTCTDICDGIAQGTAGMDYSLASREVMAMAVEMHAQAGHFDGIVMLAGCDKSLPAHLLAAVRLDRPTVVVPGGVMVAGPDGLTLEGVATAHADLKREQLDQETYEFLRQAACPSAGSCAFFGTAATMQMLSEVLGLAMPATALIPAHLNALKQAARLAGQRIPKLVEQDLRPSKIVTQQALENALFVHAATGGSTNALLHLAALAEEGNLTFSYETVQAINRRVPFILNLKPSGKFTTDKIWYAGGVPRILWELRDFLHLDVMTVTGQTLGENLDDLNRSGHFLKMPLWLTEFGGTVEDLIRPIDKPLRPTGGVRILFGNLAPDGAVVKSSAMAEAQHANTTYRARVFENQHLAFRAILEKEIQPGMAVVIRYEGPAASGMPEQFYVTEAIASDPKLATTVALITDGRFSGATRGPAVGHVSPEAAHRGPIAVVEDDDFIEMDLTADALNVTGELGTYLGAAEMTQRLRRRLETLKLPSPKYNRGLLGLYTRHALPAARGGGFSVQP